MKCGDYINTCYIFGSLVVNEFNKKIGSGDFVIAADRGLKNTERLGLVPNLIVGDFDSLHYTPVGKNVIKHPVMKDDTDLLLAIKKGFEEGYKSFEIYGCSGGRPDHTFAAIQAVCYVKENGGNAVLYGEEMCIAILQNEHITFSEDCQGIVSVFSYTESAEVTIKGLLYSLDKATITQHHPLGVSNEFTGNKAEISITNGKALVMWTNKASSFSIGGNTK